MNYEESLNMHKDNEKENADKLKQQKKEEGKQRLAERLQGEENEKKKVIKVYNADKAQV